MGEKKSESATGGYYIWGLNRPFGYAQGRLCGEGCFSGFLSRRAGTALRALGRNEPDEWGLTFGRNDPDGSGLTFGQRAPARRRRYGGVIIDY